jgi:hypothetical protein
MQWSPPGRREARRQPEGVIPATSLITEARRAGRRVGEMLGRWQSLFAKLLQLDDTLAVYPGYNYKNAPVTTIGQEKTDNPGPPEA